jgi:hypothetical protein
LLDCKLFIPAYNNPPIYYCVNDGDYHSFSITKDSSISVEFRINDTSSITIDSFRDCSYIIWQDKSVAHEIEKPEYCQVLEIIDRFFKLKAFL